jgi:hypothetical protein
MKKLDIGEATDSLAKCVRHAKETQIVVTEGGKAIAILVPVEGVDWESFCVGTSPVFQDIMERSRRSGEAEGWIPMEEVRRELGLKPFQPKKQKPRNPKPKTARASK